MLALMPALQLVSSAMPSVHSSWHSRLAAEPNINETWQVRLRMDTELQIAHRAMICIPAGAELESGRWRTAATVKFQYHLKAIMIINMAAASISYNESLRAYPSACPQRHQVPCMH